MLYSILTHFSMIPKPTVAREEAKYNSNRKKNRRTWSLNSQPCRIEGESPIPFLINHNTQNYHMKTQPKQNNNKKEHNFHPPNGKQQKLQLKTKWTHDRKMSNASPNLLIFHPKTNPHQKLRIVDPKGTTRTNLLSSKQQTMKNPKLKEIHDCKK